VEGDRPLVHLIDAPVYVFRAYHSLPPMAAPDGTPTHAAYGFASSLIKYLADFGPSHAALAFDFSDQSFRNELFPDYKAQRGQTPDDLAPQFEICVEVAQALGVPVFECEGYEADDVIATLAEQLACAGADVAIVTSDKDLAQLVREDGRIELYDLAREARLSAVAVREKFGVDPGQIPDWLALVGDAVDNLPGVPGVGPKGAAAALRAFGRIEAVPADPARWREVPVRGAGRLAALLAEHREQALRTRALATVVRDVPGVRVGLADLCWRGADRGRIQRLFARLGWGRIAERIPRWA
jgi:DNA polymerase-1